MSLSPKLIKRFFEPLVLLRVLGQVQGEKIKSAVFDSSALESIGTVEMRRRVMRCLCEMCDFKKGGDTVTAMAAINTPAGPVYWVAVTSHHEKIKVFMNQVAKMLQARALERSPGKASAEFEASLLRKFSEFQKPRLKTYLKFLRDYVEQEMFRARQSPDSATGAESYISWLQEVLTQCRMGSNPVPAVEAAYKHRHSMFLQSDYDPVLMQPVRYETEAHGQIRHCIGRICAPARAAKVLTFAAASHPFLFHDSSLIYRDTGEPVKRPQTYPGLTLEGVSNRMFSNDATRLAAFRQELQLQDHKHSVFKRLQEYYTGNDWKPRIHVELALLECLHEQDVEFFDDDRYIACSKAACFCCHLYISNHSGNFVAPSCHNKVYPNWSPPNLSPESTAYRCKQQEITMNKVVARVRSAVIDRVLASDGSKRRWHPDSSTGITPLQDSNLPSLPSAYIAPSEGFPPLRAVEQDPISEVDGSDIDDSEDGGVALQW